MSKELIPAQFEIAIDKLRRLRLHDNPTDKWETTEVDDGYYDFKRQTGKRTVSFDYQGDNFIITQEDVTTNHPNGYAVKYTLFKNGEEIAHSVGAAYQFKTSKEFFAYIRGCIDNNNRARVRAKAELEAADVLDQLPS